MALVARWHPASCTHTRDVRLGPCSLRPTGVPQSRRTQQRAHVEARCVVGWKRTLAGIGGITLSRWLRILRCAVACVVAGPIFGCGVLSIRLWSRFVAIVAL